MTPNVPSIPAPRSLAISVLENNMIKSHGEFDCDDVSWAYSFDPNSPNKDLGDWKKMPLEINSRGELRAHDSAVIVPNVQQCIVGTFPGHLILKLGITTQKVLYFRLPSYKVYSDLLACLMSWQNLKPKGLISKWNFSRSIVYDKHLQANDVLICRFKVYGPLPSNKKVAVDSRLPKMSSYPIDSESDVEEGWFTAIGHLMPNGILTLLCETDGSAIYSINVASLFSSEVRKVHSSVVQTNNVLFVGVINELRVLHGVSDDFMSNGSLLIPPKGANSSETKRLSSASRVLLDFDLCIDLEDWYVALKSVTALEYVGNTLYEKKLRLVRNVNLEILEATFEDDTVCKEHPNIYCELVMWGAPWFKTSVVKASEISNCFWKESLNLSLPCGSDYFKILLKTSKSTDYYDVEGVNKDGIVGECFITPNFFESDQFLTKVPIFDSESNVIGQLTINLSTDEVHILPYKNYKVLEKMLLNMDISKLVQFISPLVDSSHLEPWSIMMLDVFQTLHKEREFFDTLMRQELASIDSITRTHRISESISSSTVSGADSNVSGASKTPSRAFNTIFRGNSILSKALEKYDIRVGQEYLEKMLGPFIQKVVSENKNCVCDPKTCPDDYEENYKNLLGYVEILWEKIYTTSNDLPREIRDEWKNLRRNVELSVDPNDSETPLNALTAFIFLRFLCPAIMNPQLFNLTRGYHNANISRSLTLIAKVLMVFANRSEFKPHKDPSLMRLNIDFIDKHKDEIVAYYDRVTGCKMDFNEKVLDLSNSKDRLKLNTSEEILNELPTMPYLIDKYLNLTKLCQILYNEVKENGSESKSTDTNPQTDNDSALLGVDVSGLGTGDFLKNLLDDNDEEFSNILFKRDFSMKELTDQAVHIMEKVQSLERVLKRAETPEAFDEKNWRMFISSIIRSVRLTEDDVILNDQFVLHNPDLSMEEDHQLIGLLTSLSKVTPQTEDEIQNHHHHGKGNIFRKWFKHRS